MDQGILSYAVYLPRHRLPHRELGAQLGARGGGEARILASYDEDATTMAVEAARRLVSAESPPGAIYFSTTTPPYLDKTNAAAIHAALDLGHEGFAADLVGSARSAMAALRAAAQIGGLTVMSDLVTGLPTSAEERAGTDGAAAFRFGPVDQAAVELTAWASTTAEFLDRWRLPGEISSHQWEERFGLEMYLPLVQTAVSRVRERSGVDRVDHLVVSSPHSRAAATVARELSGSTDRYDPPDFGFAGAADVGLRLAAVLDQAQPGQTILVVSAVDGCDAVMLKVREPIDRARQSPAVADQQQGGREVTYAQYLMWRGLLEREPPRRPEPERPAAPPAARSEAWKFAFVGSACTQCGHVHVPPRRVCVNCGAVDQMERRPLADQQGKVATYTVDRLAFSPSPPMIDAVVDFDQGGRYTLEVADAKPDEVDIGTRLELTFRKLYTTGGVHNYFWKVRPI